MNKGVRDLIKNLCDIDAYLPFEEGDVTNILIFKQLWGNTALGFNCVGGNTVTDAFTTVLTIDDSRYVVFFNGRFAYSVENPTEKFFEDLTKQNMASINDAKLLYGTKLNYFY